MVDSATTGLMATTQPPAHSKNINTLLSLLKHPPRNKTALTRAKNNENNNHYPLRNVYKGISTNSYNYHVSTTVSYASTKHNVSTTSRTTQKFNNVVTTVTTRQVFLTCQRN